MKKYIPLSVPEIGGNEWRYVKECLDSGWVSSAGRFVEDFEHKIAERLGIKYAVACVNGTAALHTALLIAGVSNGDEVIVPTVTFIAPVNAVKYTGADCVFMDCDNYLNIDAGKIKEFMRKHCDYRNGILTDRRGGKKVKAVLPVHVFGHPVDIESLMEVCKGYNLRVIEDATESIGSYYLSGRYKGRYAGTIGDIGCLSFNGNKLITTGGGGMLITNDKKTAEKARYLTTQAKDDDMRYIHNEIGYNYRLSNIQAAMGLAQLERLPEFIEIKRANFIRYGKALSGIRGLRMLEEPPYGFSNYWFYSVLIDKRKFGMSADELMGRLAKKGIQTRPLWRLNHKQIPYKGCAAYDIVNADIYSRQVLNLPCSLGLSEGDIKYIAKEIKANAKN